MEQGPACRGLQLLTTTQTSWTIPLICILVPLLFRWIVALNPYSGFNTPPLYGDYEAQRHWMEITNALPSSQWYQYDLDWWGLDYPPLTAFHSWICGFIGLRINPDWFALDTSRGYESPESKFFMRATVVVSEALVYIPAVWCFCRIVYPQQQRKYLVLLLILMQPTLILIDHGHFQFNSVMLGFALWAINGYLTKHYLLGSVCFCLALGFKQMALYYSPAVFSFLIGTCISMPKKQQGLLLFCQLGVTVITAFGLLLSPWLASVDDLLQILHRVFPVARGLYEDKVANIWCALNVIVKLRNVLSLESTVRLSLCATLAAILPINIHLGMSPTRSRFGYALVNTSLAFFLLSFQVHEKSILLPALPISLMLYDEPEAAKIFMNVAMFSMFPLLKREGLVIPYFGITLLWNWLFGSTSFSSSTMINIIKQMIYASIFIWHVTECWIVPPNHWPDLYTVVNAIISCGYFSCLFLYFTYRQFYPSSSSTNVFGESSVVKIKST
ncbi:glycosyl transferase [Phascolomyces articulosus]|uniref:Alpha-1,3-glucosyltransferase n=1 Tax=Phascolomyces articulosus TaxID=60185 RepID=A0AAD5PD14_9FUNG|nr:glycosyl transferase [Phascolomyces articulosus]